MCRLLIFWGKQNLKRELQSCLCGQIRGGSYISSAFIIMAFEAFMAVTLAS